MAAAAQPDPKETTSQTPPTESRPKPAPLYKWVTTCPTDWFVLRVRGEDLVGITHSVVGYRIDDNFEFEKLLTDEPNIISPFRLLTGRDFIGIKPLRRTGLYRYKSNWNKFRTKQQGDDNIPVQVVQEHGEEIVTFIPFVSQYPLVFPGVEVIGTEVEGTGKRPLIPVTFIITVRVRMLKPRISVMQNVDWLGNVVTVEIRQFLKTWAAGRSYDELFRGSDVQQAGGQRIGAQVRTNITREFREFFLGTRLVDDPTKMLRSPARRKILEQGGVDLISIDVVDIVPDKEFEASLLKQAKTRIDAETGVIAAEGKRREREQQGLGEEAYEASVGKGRAAGIEAIKKAAGADAETYLKWFQLQNTNLTTYVEAGARASIIVGPDGKPIK